MNAGFYKSIDGGKSFGRIRVPHGDNHDLWINPQHPVIMIEANDGGACITLNDCRTWSSIYNQPTAEFYRVSIDQQYPYRVYGAQQDNSTISVPSRPTKGLDPIQEWYAVGGGESGHISVDPDDPNLIYAGTYIGQIDRTNLLEGHQQDIVAYPQMHDGTAPRDIKYRFQWNAPILISPHQSNRVYHCSQFVHMTEDKGVTWKTISPDLTTDNDSQQDIPGGPIQHDHTGVELYNTIFSFAESPHQGGELWTGSDDGLMYISKDGGANWEDITPKDMPDEGTVNSLDLSEHTPGKAVAAVYKYRDNDFKPYVFLTKNYGKTWRNLCDGKNGIPEDHFVRVVREDKNDPNIFYAGTEFGMYISLDEGKSWKPFQNNLPITPITDIVLHQGDMVVATQGRSFWILDNIAGIGAYNQSGNSNQAGLYGSKVAYRSRYRQHRGQNTPDRAPAGAMIDIFIPSLADTSKVSLSIVDPYGVTRRTYTNQVDKDNNDTKYSFKDGLNRLEWNMRYERPKPQPKSVFSLASLSGIKAPPGEHTLVLEVDGEKYEQKLTLAKDPRWSQTEEDMVAQYELTMQIKSLFDKSHETIGDIRSVMDQAGSLAKRPELETENDVLDLCKSISTRGKSLEEKLIQTKSESGQDPINYPSMIDDQIAYLYSNLNGQDHKPSQGAYDRLNDLETELNPLLEEAAAIMQDVDKLNEMCSALKLPLVKVKYDRFKP